MKKVLPAICSTLTLIYILAFAVLFAIYQVDPGGGIVNYVMLFGLGMITAIIFPVGIFMAIATIAFAVAVVHQAVKDLCK